ncbi:DUF2798 domain-containing protein [Acinetobacter stercoris]|uniref:DUF2798 domain-containing protein n=1 Tax=Acinetobacter stercoris TaxID=2126983 RepID=A0A2U3MVH8_9GAMM|nr:MULTISPECIES: DUF2798 domain-containing protein [Acinetobacter]SPL69448.1 hypothetical protein KPC_0626 [Acinetobacter stercoris]
MQNKPVMMIGNIPKLPARAMAWVLPLLLSGLMSGTISMINLWKNLGWIDGFFAKWFSVWLFSWMIAYPTVLLFLPLVRRICALFIDVPPSHSS